MGTFRYQHLRNNIPNLKPSPSDIREGEIAVNFAADNEKLFIKNTDNQIVSFITEAQVDAKLSGGTADSVTVSTFNAYTADTETKLNSKANTTHTHTSNDITDLETKIETVATSAITQNASVKGAVESVVNSKLTSYSSATEVNTALAGKANASHTHTSSDITDFSTALGSYTYDKDTIDNKISQSGTFDPTVYYKKSETSGKTEIATALNGKADSSHTHNTSDINNFASDIESVIASSTTITDRIENVVTSAITQDASVNAAVESVVNSKLTSYSSATEVNTALGGKANSTHAHASSDISDLSTTLSDFTYDKNTIDSKIGQGGTFDPTLYYMKTETSGSTEISTALSDKVSTSDFNDKLGSGFTSSSVTEVIEDNERIILASLNDLNARINEVSGNVTTAISVDVASAKEVTDFMKGHNSVASLSNIPTDKRLVIATISSSSNELSLSGNTLADGYEIHVMVKNEGENEATVTIPSIGGYVKIGNDIKIASGAIGEINIISDGTNLYVRGV